MGRERSRITPAAEDARHQYGGSPASCHRRNLRNSPPACKRKKQRHQQRFNGDPRDAVAILHVPPPICDQVAELARCLRDIFRQLRPGFIGVDAGYRLKQCRCEVLAANLLDGVE